MILPKRKKVSPMVPVSSMADIAFLLIIFFILTTQFMKEPNMPLELPKDATISAVDQSPILVSIDEAGVIYVDGQETPREAVEAKLGTSLADSNAEQKFVHFKCDANLPRKIFEPVLIAISEAGGVIVPLGEKVSE